MTLLVIGEALVDIVTRTDGTVLERPGGSPLNVAVGLGRLGHEVQLLTALGDDDHGRLVTDHVTASHVELLVAPLARTATADARLDGSGAATYVFDIAWDLTGAPSYDAPDWLHVGSIGTTLQPGADQVAALVTSYAGRVSFDPNCRPLLMGTPDLARVEALVAASDVVKLSDEDAAWLSPGESHLALAKRWLDLGPSLVVVTLGPDGAVAVTSEGVREIPLAAGDPVIDTVGAGDSFMAGLISGLVDGVPVNDALGLAARTSRITCSRVGADPPWKDQL